MIRMTIVWQDESKLQHVQTAHQVTKKKKRQITSTGVKQNDSESQKGTLITDRPDK